MTKRAIAAVSFGTTVPKARESIAAVENRLACAFPEWDCFRCFTSGMVREKIFHEEKTAVHSPDSLLTYLKEQGYEEAVFQSLHMIPGQEFEKLKNCLAAHRESFSALSLGAPLLCGWRDCLSLIPILDRHLPTPGEGEALLLMGHGSEHWANAVYSLLQYCLDDSGRSRVVVATVEGYPDLEAACRRLERLNVRRVTLAPLMLVAGEHALSDMAGEGADSWRSILTAKGFEAAVSLKSLGTMAEIAEIFAEHALNARPL